MIPSHTPAHTHRYIHTCLYYDTCEDTDWWHSFLNSSFLSNWTTWTQPLTLNFSLSSSKVRESTLSHTAWQCPIMVCIMCLLKMLNWRYCCCIWVKIEIQGACLALFSVWMSTMMLGIWLKSSQKSLSKKVAKVIFSLNWKKYTHWCSCFLVCLYVWGRI